LRVREKPLNIWRKTLGQIFHALKKSVLSILKRFTIKGAVYIVAFNLAQDSYKMMRVNFTITWLPNVLNAKKVCYPEN
jgi:hypothetical protein